MTRNQALLAVCAQFEGKNCHTEEITKLKEVAAFMPFTEWNTATLKDAVEYFMAVNGRLPTVTDFKKENGLPSNSVIKQRYKMNLREWLDEYFPAYYKPNVTRKQALLFAYENTRGETREKIGELISEYPVCRWTKENILDGVEEFFGTHGRLPCEREFNRKNHLPDYGHILYKYKCGLRAWYKTYCGELFTKSQNAAPPTRDYLSEFIAEYERIQPCSKEEFNRRRNPAKCCLAEAVMRNAYITSWSELLKKCSLRRYEKPIFRLIEEIEVIVLDENSEELYRYNLHDGQQIKPFLSGS